MFSACQVLPPCKESSGRTCWHSCDQGRQLRDEQPTSQKDAVRWPGTGSPHLSFLPCHPARGMIRPAQEEGEGPQTDRSRLCPLARATNTSHRPRTAPKQSLRCRVRCSKASQPKNPSPSTANCA